MKNKFFSILCFLSLQSFAQIIGVDTLLKNGPISKRINLVIMGDGYTAAQMTQFITNASTSFNYLLNTSPFSNYKKYFNVFAIKVASPQSGISHPGTATDVTEPLSPTLSVTNNFNTKFDNYGIHRNIYAMDPVAVYSVLAAAFPAYDQVLILGNSTEYGGAGGSYAVSSINVSSPEIVAHEMGHSFAGLADEYWSGNGWEKPNMTAATFTSAVKWGPWVGLSAIGIYPYGTTSPSSQWFRPHQNCKMQLLNTPFCAVCKQTIIEKIHSLVNPVDEYFPDNSTAITPSASAQWFKGIFVKPNPNTLKRTWEVNGNIVDLNKDSTLVDNTMLWQGNNTVVLTVMDTTVLSKDTGHVNLHSYSVFWDINYSMVGIKEIKPKLELSVFPNPASEALRLKYRLLEDSNIGISVMDLNGRTLMEEKTVASIAGDYERSLNVSELKEGNYILALKINNQVITTKFIIIK